jgi:hypothetical protein
MINDDSNKNHNLKSNKCRKIKNRIIKNTEKIDGRRQSWPLVLRTDPRDQNHYLIKRAKRNI